MLTVLTIVLVLMAIAMIALILLQRGQGATAGAAFGTGASGTVFGARGASSFLTRATTFLAICFFGISLAMAVMISRGVGVGGPEGLQISAPTPAADASFEPNAPLTLDIPEEGNEAVTTAIDQVVDQASDQVENSDLPTAPIEAPVDDVPVADNEADDN